jgi:hypothetical protein
MRDTPKVTHIGISGLKIYHLATLDVAPDAFSLGKVTKCDGRFIWMQMRQDFFAAAAAAGVVVVVVVVVVQRQFFNQKQKKAKEIFENFHSKKTG